MASSKMKENEAIDTRKVLPNDVRIPSADFHLYRIGLCLTYDHRNGDKKRNRINNPKLIFLTNIVMLLKSLFNVLISDNYLHLLVYSGDVGEHFGMRIHLNIAIFLSSLFMLCSQYNYFSALKS